MKRIIIALLLLCISFSYCFYSYKVLKDKNNEFYSMITECQAYIIEENKKMSEKKIDEIAVFWDKNHKIYRILVEGDYCEKISEGLSAAQISFIINETSETITGLNECKETLKHILEKERLSFEAIL